MKQRLLLYFLLTFGVRSLAQHNEVQSLYMYDALSVNPAYAGNKGALALNANYRDQWGGVKGSPKTLSFTAHVLTRSKKNGLGIMVFNDKFGIQTDLKINAVYAYKIRLKHDEISLGVSGGIVNRSIDLDALNLHSTGDATFMNQPQKTIAPDVAFGAMYKSKRLLFGFSVPNLVRSDYVNTAQAVNGYLSVVLGRGDVKLKPSVLARYAVHSPLSFDGNLTLYYRQSLSFGAGMRNDKTTNVHLRVQLNRQLGIAYLYERNFTSLSRFMGNTHEFMVNYIFDYQTNVQSPRYL